jgi:serine/threonine-protein phosphatase 6 regulatory ankyrin repeat subunit B
MKTRTKVLFQSTESGAYAEVKRSLEEGADVNAQTKEGYTALMMASVMGHTEIAKLLIEEGADVNAQTKDGWTALMRASSEGKIEVAELLRKAGAKE